MATGYTDPVGRGLVTDFSQFALQCTRAMGVAIMQRDEDGRAPLRLTQEPDTHYRDREQKYTIDVLWWSLADDAEVLEKQRIRVAEVNEFRASRRCEVGARIASYEAMLAQVEAWVPPTVEHEGLKRFMIEQLTESIRFDRPLESDSEEMVMVSAAAYRASELAKARRMRDEYAHQWAEEQRRTRERAEWVATFLGSLPDPEAHQKAVAAYEALRAAEASS